MSSGRRRRQLLRSSERDLESATHDNEASGNSAADEDDGFLIRKLLITLDDVVLTSQRPPRACGQADRSPSGSTPEQKLVRCMRKIISATAARRTQVKLQDLMLNWLNRPDPPQVVCPRDLKKFVSSRQEFWQVYRADTHKWQTLPDGPIEGVSQETSQPSLARVLAGSVLPTSSPATSPGSMSPSRSPWRSALETRGQQHRVLGGRPTSSGGGRIAAFSPASSFTQSDSRRHATLSSFGRPRSGAKRGGADRPPTAPAVARRARGLVPLDQLSVGLENAAMTPSNLSSSVSLSDLYSTTMAEVSWIDAMDPTADSTSRPPVLPDLSKSQSMPGLVHLDELVAGNGRSCRWAFGQVAQTNAMEEPMLGLDKSLSLVNVLHRPSGANFRRTFEEQDSGVVVQSGTWRYFQECQKLKMVPRVPKLLLEEPIVETRTLRSHLMSPLASGTPGGRRLSAGFKNGVPTIAISGDMGDKDLQALAEPLNQHTLGIVNVDLSRNKFSDAGVTRFLDHLNHNWELRSLSLSYSGAANAALGLVTRKLQTSWSNLEVLELAGCVLSESTWASFCSALCEHDGVVELDLSETGLGAISQRSVRHLARFAADARHLQRLCVGGNYIFHEGFEALASTVRRTATIESLDVSHNAMTHIGNHPSATAASPQVVTRRKAGRGGEKTAPRAASAPQAARRPASQGGQCKGNEKSRRPCEASLQYNPMALLCEALGENDTLIELCMASSSLDYAVDVVLLAALASNTTLQYLDISSNPHGEQGIKALLRVLMDPESSLVSCIVADFRECSPGASAVVLNFGAPSGRYDLDLGHPQHRAVARWLLAQAAEQSAVGYPAEAFSGVSYVWPDQATKLRFSGNWYSQSSAGGWEVPTAGRLQLDFFLDLNLKNEKTTVCAIRRWMSSRRIPVTFCRFVLLHELFAGLRLEHKALLIHAMADSLLLKTCHLQKFLRTCPALHDEMVRNLYPCLVDTQNLLLFELMSKHKGMARAFRQEARTLFFCQDANPTGHYSLNLDTHVDRFVAERIQVLNSYEKAVAISLKMPDTSQHGNHEGTRNVSWVGKDLESFEGFPLPVNTTGFLNLDYVSPPHCAPRRSTTATDERVMAELMEALELSACCPEDKLMAFRTISHHLLFSVAQVAKLCRLFPNPNVRSTLAEASQKLRRVIKSSGTSVMLGLSPGRTWFKKSAFQYEFENCSADMFIVLFNRCRDQAELCTTKCLYDLELFSPACAQYIRTKLGVIRTFDAIHCCGNKEVNAKGDTTSARFLAQLYAAQGKKQQEEDGGGACSQDAIFQTIAPDEIGVRYRLNLPIFEEWTIAHFLLLLTEKEPGTHFLKGEWSERAFLQEQGYDFFVPAAWVTDLPRIGMFEFTYITEKLDYKRLEWRRRLAERLCGWEKSKA